MTFDNWTLDDLIRYLQVRTRDAKDCPCTHTIRCSGKINIYKGENKSTRELESDIEEVLE